MKVGILGAGSIARAMAMAVNGLEGVEGYAVASRELGKAQAFCDQWGFQRAYGSYEEMLQDPQVDLVYVATPHSHHFDHMMLCLKHGKHVICENPCSLDSEQLKVLLNLAEEKKLDLVNISPNAKPPVCKILDYGKYRYELQKKEKEAKKKQKTTQIKEIRLSTFIEDHDIQVKAKTASKFLQDGDKVKVSLRFRGRERDYQARGMEVMNAFAASVADVSVIEKKPLFEGRSLTMVLGPKTEK